MRETILLFNPHSTTRGKQRLPMSLLSIAAMIAPDYDFELIDGNLIDDPAAHIIERARATNAKLLGVTVMPGPQLEQAVPACKRIKQALPELTIIWGGYFPSTHYETVMRSDFVDYVIVSQGEVAFRRFVDTFFAGGSMDDVPSLVWRKDGETCVNQRAPVAPLDNLPRYPYEHIELENYIGTSYLGRRVSAHHTSWGCPFACSFCAVVPLAKQRWSAESPERVASVIDYKKKHFNIDGIEFHDMDFFIREDRTAEIAERMISYDVNWWAMGRIDTLMSYSDTTFEKLRDSGIKMIFMGAEAGDDETLKMMNKGGKSGTDQTLAIVERMKQYNIVPELSFVLGTPPDPLESVNRTVKFIRKVKAINPATEIILYMYTPTPQERSNLFNEVQQHGFAFPQTLEEWASPDWTAKQMRRNPDTPWSQDPIRNRVRNFETVLNAYYPTVTDMRLRGTIRQMLKALGGWRYKLEFYQMPYELKVLQRLIKYRRPETMGF